MSWVNVHPGVPGFFHFGGMVMGMLNFLVVVPNLFHQIPNMFSKFPMYVPNSSSPYPISFALSSTLVSCNSYEQSPTEETTTYLVIAFWWMQVYIGYIQVYMLGKYIGNLGNILRTCRNCTGYSIIWHFLWMWEHNLQT